MNIYQETLINKKIEKRSIKYLEKVEDVIKGYFKKEKNKTTFLNFFYASNLFDKCVYRNKIFRDIIYNKKLPHNKKIFTKQIIIKFLNKSFIYILIPLKITLDCFNYIFLKLILNIFFNYQTKKHTEENQIYIVYPDDENNNSLNSRYFKIDEDSSVRISLGYPQNFLNFFNRIRLIKVENRIFPIESFIKFNYFLKIFFVSIFIYLRTTFSIFLYIWKKIKHKKFNKFFHIINKRLSLYTFLFLGDCFRRQLIIYCLREIIEKNRYQKISFPIEGAYWENAFLGWDKLKSKQFNPFLNSFPKIFDSRLKTHTKKNIVKELPFIKFKYDFYGKIDEILNNLNEKKNIKRNVIPIKAEDSFLIILNGIYEIDLDLLHDFEKIRKLNADIKIFLRPHPDSKIKALQKRIKTFSIKKFIKKEINPVDILIASIHSSFTLELDINYKNRGYAKSNFNHPIKPYVDPYFIKRFELYNDISEIIEF
tara:strand:- start:52013 stop:53452 length:1440 start_codon:yes stop_codon:yes gene_type:complete